MQRALRAARGYIAVRIADGRVAITIRYGVRGLDAQSVGIRF